MKNITHWKTTLLGIIILVFNFKYLYASNADRTTFFVLLGVSLALFFTPDSIGKMIRDIINKFIK